jgi:hypothetical protein
MFMPKPKPKGVNALKDGSTCIACNGTGVSSSGRPCIPCTKKATTNQKMSISSKIYEAVETVILELGINKDSNCWLQQVEDSDQLTYQIWLDGNLVKTIQIKFIE